tara:strand:+ start:13361 stop:14647 length:1287 start_codon:yes stop_codon:yes gene_type:complete
MSDGSARRIVIVGGGQAAVQACQSLRSFGFGGDITLISEEPDLPYQRPPLSKACLKGEMATDRLQLKPEKWFRDNHVDLKRETRVTQISRGPRTVHLNNGEVVSYDALILATGARARRLSIPGEGLGGVLYLRTREDVDRLRAALGGIKKVVLIGGGYIGLETAASCRSLGHDVTVLEAAKRVLARVTHPELSGFFQAQHTARGVDIRTDTKVSEILEKDGMACGVRTTDGTVFEADIVIIGAGADPNTDLATAARLQCERGILVGGDARTSDPRIFAIGDCASRPLELCARQVQLESVHNAIEQAKQAASVLCGMPRPKYECPWFWSDQFDLKLQIAGLSADFDDVVVKTDGDKSFTVFYFQRGDLIAVDAVNAASNFLFTKRALEIGARVRIATIADEKFDFRSALLNLRPAITPRDILDLNHIDH